VISRISEYVQGLWTVVDWWTRFVSTSGVSFGNDPDEESTVPIQHMYVCEYVDKEALAYAYICMI